MNIVIITFLWDSKNADFNALVPKWYPDFSCGYKKIRENRKFKKNPPTLQYSVCLLSRCRNLFSWMRIAYHYSWRFPVWKFYHIRLSYWELAVALGFWLQKIRQHSFFRMLPSFCYAPIRRLPYTSYIEIWRLKFNVWIARSSSSGWGVRQGRRPKSYPLFPAKLPLSSVWIPLPLNLALNNRTSRLQKAILNL